MYCTTIVIKEKNFSTPYQIKMTSFPRLSSLSKTDANYVKAKRLNKDFLLSQIYQLQSEMDNLNGKVSILQDKTNSQSLKDWSDVLNRTNELATERAKSDCRETWSDLKKVVSAISFKIRTA